MRQAEIVKQPPDRSRKRARTKRAQLGQRAIERYVERLLETARRLRKGPEASELYCAAAELYEGTTQHDPVRATELYARGLDAFGLSRLAHLGLRRLARKSGDVQSTIAALQREIGNATGERSRTLRLELARTLLYQADRPNDALLLLEALEQERKLAFDAWQQAKSDKAETIKKALEGDAPEGDEPELRVEAASVSPQGGRDRAAVAGGPEGPQPAAWMAIETFFVWEDALWATAQWRRYEELLREALTRRHAAPGLTQLVERRLLHLYQYILPDNRQAELIIDHLVDHGELDPELVEHALRRLEREGNHEEIVEVLTRALAEPACATHETTWRMLLADVARHHFDDLDHACDIVRAGVDNHKSDPILIHELLSLQEERGDLPGLVDALGCSLEILVDPAARADVLCRIGTILLDDLDLEEAAEEVFEEAVRELPTHRQTLRTLGRLYQTRQDWHALVALYEAEVAVSSEPDCWRKRLSLAELYEERLDEPEQAFAQYAAVLDERPTNLSALKGASRVTARIGCWTALLERYAAAEAATDDQRERLYLLERIAQIAEEHLRDLETARTALEGLRVLDARHPGALASLARLYAKLGQWAALVALTDEELGQVEEARAAAALLVRNAQLCEDELADEARAEGYYRKALERVATCRPALEGLGRLLQRQKRWEDLVALGLSEAESWGDAPEARQRLHVVADILERQLGRVDDATALYWRCLAEAPDDRHARDALMRLFRKADDWEKVCEILELEAEHGGRGGYPAATLFRLGQLREHRLEDRDGALDAYRRAFLSDPGDPVLLRAWLSMARKLNRLDGPRKVLTSASSKPATPQARVELLVALAEFSLLETRDPLTVSGFLEIVESIEPGRESAATLLSMALARSGRWAERIAIGLKAERHGSEREHGMQGALVLGAPEAMLGAVRATLGTLDEDDAEKLTHAWALLSPGSRPEPRALAASVRADVSAEAQDLRRWATVRALVAGDLCDDLSQTLLPDARQHRLTLRAEMQLLAAHFEVAEQHKKLLEVLTVMEEMAPSANERTVVAVERARVLERLGKTTEALGVVRDGFKGCAWDDPVRAELYDYLEAHGDWERLVAELRRHLRHSEDPSTQSRLWKRLSHALETGLGELDEALRALDAAYRCLPGDGALLPEIARVAESLGEVQIARRALDDYLMVHRPPIEAELEICGRFVELHIEQSGGDVRRALAYLEDLVRRSADERRALEALAEAHAGGGSPYVACEVLLRLVRLPYREEDLTLWLRLASLYGGALGERPRGENLLWELLANFADSAEVWQAVDGFYRGRGGREALAARLREFADRGEELGLSREQRRHFLGILGRLLGDELGQWRSARLVYSEAIELAEVAQPELSRQRAWALVRIPGEAKQAYRGFCELLVEDPFAVDVMKAALELSDRSEAWDRSRILRQLAALFVPEAELHVQDAALRPKIDVTRDLDDGLLQGHLLHPKLRGLYDVLHEALPVVEQVFKDDIPRLSVVGGKRLRGRSEMSELFNHVAARLGLGSVRVFLGNDESPLPMVFASPAAFWIPADRWQSMEVDEKRHWAGYAAGLLWTGLAPMVNLDGKEIWQLLDGIYYSVTGDGLNGTRTAYTIEAAEKVKSPWYRRARKEISTLLKGLGPAARSDEAGQWPRWLQGSGDRTGLLFSGNLGVSVRALLAAEGWRGELGRERLAGQFERNPRVRDLVDFALSEDYLHLRHAAGLAQRPSTITG